MSRPTPLAELQLWMLDAIRQPGARIGPPDVDARILGSRQQTAGQRLAVYADAYFARLLEVLAELFPCLRHAVGDELFAEFAAGYLEAYPPTSYTLHRLADHFPEYLEATRPTDFPALAFVVELARLEQAIDRVFDGPGPEELPLFEFPAEGASADELRLALVPGMELLSLRFPASSYFTVWKNGEADSWPPAAPQYVALFRRDYVVRRFELSRVQFVLLEHIARGATLAEAIEAAANIDADAELSPTDMAPAAELAEELRDWFTRWSAAGFFASTKSPNPEAG
ncbi:MAG: DNA-binding domain-containing protein [Pirellulaceae bacterium]|nr:DNA-binding domain-containing protein [Pirellulaceae bacterium]